MLHQLHAKGKTLRPFLLCYMEMRAHREAVWRTLFIQGLVVSVPELRTKDGFCLDPSPPPQ